MHVRIITRFIAILILFLGLSMAGPLLVAFLFKDRSILALLFSLIITSRLHKDPGEQTTQSP